MIILRQKEYTSIGRKIGAKIGRLRANLANKAYKRAAIQEVENERLGHKVELYKSNQNNNSGYRLALPLIRSSRNMGIQIKPNNENKFNLTTNIDGSKPIINADLKANQFSPAFSHELGHYVIRKGYDTKGKKIEDKLRRIKSRKTPNNFLGQLYRQHRENKYTLKNENKASENALTILKDLGANNEELKYANDVLKTGGKTYETAQKSKVLENIANRINIKDRRNTRVMYKGGEPVHVGMTKFKLERRKKK